MVPRRYSSEGVVLARRNYSEADRILVVYSKDYGKVHLLAKGVRKLKSRKRGGVETFNQIKFAASRGKGLDIVTEVQVIDAFSVVRNNLKTVSVAFFLCETTGRLTKDEQPNKDMFALLLSALKSLGVGKGLRQIREKFIKDCLVLLGFWPESKIMRNHDKVLESVTEREMTTVRVGKKLQNI